MDTWHFPSHFGVIVIGAGHAGCEAAHASAKMGASTLLLTGHLDTIAKMSCNPSVGGTAKGHIVREIDALGGLMGRVADRTRIHGRMLNQSKGPAIWSPRLQCDKWRYSGAMKEELERTPKLSMIQGQVCGLSYSRGYWEVLTQEGVLYRGRQVIVSSGTFLRGLMHLGLNQMHGGRAGDSPSNALSDALKQLGLKLGRFKTGTPPRVHAASIDWDVMEPQPSQEWVRLSYDSPPQPPLPQRSCFITYTRPHSHELIRNNFHRSPLYCGIIEGTGPRYCPSIEDKVKRFADKERHQIFVEPEGLDTQEVYLNGLSSSLPLDVQQQLLHSIPGLERAHVMRYGYAIEYDYALCGQIDPYLQVRGHEGLFLAGQINGTTGYEEAAAQGLVAGIHAAQRDLERPLPHWLRSESYIGVMLDDLTTKPLSEPYRMFTSRAEYRLLLRQDNADLRLRERAYALGMIDHATYADHQRFQQAIDEELRRLSETYTQVEGKSVSLRQWLTRPEVSYRALQQGHPQLFPSHEPRVIEQVEIAIKYAGYIQRELGSVEALKKQEELDISSLAFEAMAHLSHEARERLIALRPATLGQASRIMGVTPSDLQLICVYAHTHQRQEQASETLTSFS